MFEGALGELALGESPLVSSGETGSLSKTLDNATIASSGTVLVTGVLSKTLGDLSLQSSGNVGSVVLGSLNSTLQSCTLSSSGKVLISGHTSKSLRDATMGVTRGRVLVRGNTDEVLSAISLSGQGSVSTIANLDKTLESISILAHGGMLAIGSAEISLEDISHTLSGKALINAQLNKLLDGLSNSIAGIVLVQGYLDKTLDSATLVGRVELGRISVGGLSTELSPLTLNSKGSVQTVGDLSQTLGQLECFATDIEVPAYQIFNDFVKDYLWGKQVWYVEFRDDRYYIYLNERKLNNALDQMPRWMRVQKANLWE